MPMGHDPLPPPSAPEQDGPLARLLRLGLLTRLRGLGLRWKIAGMAAGSAALVAVLLVAASTQQMDSLLTEELHKRGEAVSIGLANNLAFALFSRDEVGLKAAVESTLRDIPDTAYVVLRTPSGEVLASGVHPDVARGGGEPQAAGQVPEGRRVVGRELSLGGHALLDFTAPARFAGAGAQAADAAAVLDPFAVDAAPAQAGKGEQVLVGLVQVGFRADAVRAQVAHIAGRALLLGLVVLLACGVAASLLSRMLTEPLVRLAEAAAGIARGDLAQRVEVQGEDEIADLARSFERMAGGLRGMLGDLHAASREIEREAATILATATQQASLSNQQAAALQQASLAVTEIAQTAQLATGQADSVIRVTERSEQLSSDGQRVVDASVAGMRGLGEQVAAIATRIDALSTRTAQISLIIGTVKDLAEQSNMLALNASIEAMKAGEHGRGFAVVATEMRSLAEQSKRAAGQVRDILEELQESTRAAVQAGEEGSRRAKETTSQAQRAGSTIEGLAEVIRESAQAARQIATHTRQQTSGVEQIAPTLRSLSTAMAEAVAGTHTIEAVAGSLGTLASRLSGLVGRYRT